MKKIFILLLSFILFVGNTQLVWASTYDFRIPWGSKNDYTGFDGSSFNGAITVNPFTLAANGANVDTVTGSCVGITCYPTDPAAYYNGFNLSTSLTFSVTLNNNNNWPLLDNFWFEAHKVGSCAGYDLNTALSEGTLVNCSVAAGYTNQSLATSTAKQMGVNIPPHSSVTLTYTWTPSESGYYQFDFSSDDYGYDYSDATVFHSGFIRIIDPITPTPTSNLTPTPTSNLTPTLTPTPTSTTAPTINSLQINNIDSHGFTGAAKTSGLQYGPEGGSGWYNPMTITLNAAAGSAPISNYYVAFYDKNSGTQLTSQATFLTDIKTRINSNPQNGFLLRYSSSGNYYVWDYSLNNWRDISGFSLEGWPICGSAGCPTQTYYYAYPVSARTWKIQFYKPFGTKNMYTAGYVEDGNGLSGFQADLNPQ